MPSDARVRLDRDGRVASLVLTGRGDTNAMDLRLVRELDEATEQLATAAAAGDVDLVVIRADGRNFCVGGDLRDFAAATDVSAHVATMAGHAHRGIGRLHALDVPIVARLQGAVAGGGIGLLLTADIIIAASSASLTAGYAAAGLSPDGAVSWVLPRLIGEARALELLLTNRRVMADELVALGVVSRTVDEEDLDRVVEETVASMTRLPGEVLRANKRLVAMTAGDTLSAHLDAEAASIAALTTGDHARALIESFRAAGSSPPAPTDDAT